MAFTLPELPYAPTALEPYISANTFSFHHGKHHAAYVTNLNKLIEGTELADKSLEEIVLASAGDASKAGIFNNAAQVWNHTFYWNCMKPSGGGAPTGALAEKISADFGSFDKFKEEFKNAGVTQFGSGWAWLVLDSGTLICSVPLLRRNAYSFLRFANSPAMPEVSIAKTEVGSGVDFES